MFINNVKTAALNWAHKLGEQFTRAKPITYCARIWKGSEPFKNMAFRTISMHPKSCLILSSTALGLMVSKKPSELEEDVQKLTTLAMQAAYSKPLHPMGNPSEDLERTILSYLQDQFAIALKDPSTLEQGCVIEVSHAKVVAARQGTSFYIPVSEMTFPIPQFKVVVSADTFKAVTSGKENVDPIRILDGSENIPM